MQFSEYRIKEKSLVVGQVVLGLIILWSLLYNILIKKQQLFVAFFGIIDTLTEDLFMRAGFGMFAAVALISIFILSDLYAKMLSLNHFFRQMEIIFTKENSLTFLPKKKEAHLTSEEHDNQESPDEIAKEISMFEQIIDSESKPIPLCNYPLSGTNSLVALSVLYVFHVFFLFLLSEPIALLVRLNSNDVLINSEFVIGVAVMALSLPLSIRLLAALGYKQTRQISYVLPFLCVLCTLFICLPLAFNNMDASFLESVYNHSAFWNIFVREILLLAFIPTFLEGILWMLQIFALKEEQEE